MKQQIKQSCLIFIFFRANAYHYNDGTMFAQQATTPYLDPGQQSFTTVTTPGAVSSGQTLLQVNTPSGPTMQAQRHPITHTTRASPATVSEMKVRIDLPNVSVTWILVSTC